MVELADTPDLGSGAPRRGGSSPLIRTIFLNLFKIPKKLNFHLNLSNLLIQNLVEIFTYQTIYIKFIKFIDQILKFILLVIKI